MVQVAPRRMATPRSCRERIFDMGEQRPVWRLSERSRRKIVITRSLVAQRTIDQDEVWRGSVIGDLAGGRNTDEQPAAGGKELFGHEHRERSAHGAADNPGFSNAIEIEGEELSVVASPPRVGATPRRRA